MIPLPLNLIPLQSSLHLHSLLWPLVSQQLPSSWQFSQTVCLPRSHSRTLLRWMMAAWLLSVFWAATTLPAALAGFFALLFFPLLHHQSPLQNYCYLTLFFFSIVFVGGADLVAFRWGFFVSTFSSSFSSSESSSELLLLASFFFSTFFTGEAGLAGCAAFLVWWFLFLIVWIFLRAAATGLLFLLLSFLGGGGRFCRLRCLLGWWFLCTSTILIIRVLFGAATAWFLLGLLLWQVVAFLGFFDSFSSFSSSDSPSELLESDDSFFFSWTTFFASTFAFEVASFAFVCFLAVSVCFVGFCSSSSSLSESESESLLLLFSFFAFHCCFGRWGWDCSWLGFRSRFLCRQFVFFHHRCLNLNHYCCYSRKPPSS